MRSLRMGPLLVAIVICVLFSLIGNALIGESSVLGTTRLSGLLYSEPSCLGR